MSQPSDTTEASEATEPTERSELSVTTEATEILFRPVLRQTKAATITRLTPGRRYTVLGDSCSYHGRTPAGREHLFESRRGLIYLADGWAHELMARGEITPEGPSAA